MSQAPLLDGISASVVETPRLKTHILTSGPADGEPVLLIHGNCAAARFFEETMLALPARFRAIAPDLRGYGRSETAPVDATRGVRDWSDDLRSLVTTLGLERPHLVGWSLGGSIAMQYVLDYPAEVASLTLIAPGSPFGFGGTRGLEGTPSTPDFAGSGGGAANADFVQRLRDGDRTSDSPLSPRNVMNSFYFHPPFRATNEEVLLDEVLSTAIGDDNYPGDGGSAADWPMVGPGSRGVTNALSPKYFNQAAFATIEPKPPVLWVRGDSDMIVSDTSAWDLGFLGQLGAVPGWPGADVFPPQPMVGQMRAVLDRYQEHGGRYREVVLTDCGHSPHVEQPAAFQAALIAQLEGAQEAE